MKLKSKLIALLLGICSFSANAEERDSIRPQPIAATSPAAVKEIAARDRAFLIASIKSEADLKEHLDVLELTSSPLKALSYDGRQRFIQSLKFNETGLTGFNYADIQKELNTVQAYKILALFGKQHVTGMVRGEKRSKKDDALLGPMSEDSDMYPDYMSRECIKRATCRYSSADICMSGC